MRRAGRASNVAAVLSGVSTPTLALTGSPDPSETGRAYLFQPTATGGSGTKSYAFTGAVTPASLGGSFSTVTGAITGPYTTAGTVTGTITVTDTSGSAPLAVSIPVAASPSLVANLMMSLDASNVDTLVASVGAVRSWGNSYGGTVSALQTSNAFNPVAGARMMNGLPVVDFNGVLNKMVLNLDYTAGYTIFAVLCLDANSIGPSVSFLGGANGSLSVRMSSARKVILGVNGGSTLVTSTASLPKDQLCLLTVKVGSWGYSIAINSAADVSGATVAALTQPINNLCSVTGSFIYFDGAVAALNVYSGNVAGGDVTAIESFLAAKWLTPHTLPASPITWADGEIITWADGTSLAWAA